MLPYPLFEKVGQIAKLSAQLANIDDTEIQKRKALLDDWIFDKCAAFDFRPALNLLLKTTAVAVPVTAGGMLLAYKVKEDANDLVNKTLLKAGLASMALSALGLGAYRMLQKQSAEQLTSATLFKALKKLATIGMVDSILEQSGEKYAALRRINRAYGVQIIADMVE